MFKTGDGLSSLEQSLSFLPSSEQVKMTVYGYYMRAIGSGLTALTILFYVGSQTCTVLSNIWLSKWSEDVNSTQPAVRDLYLGVYGGLGIGQGESSLRLPLIPYQHARMKSVV